MGSFSDKFKNDSLKKTVNSLQEKYKPQEIKRMSQNEMIQTLEKEKTLEKDDKVKANYDLIIEAIKEWFANKLNEEQAKLTIKQKAKDELLAQKALEVFVRRPELENEAKQILGNQFIEDLKKNNAYTKRQSTGWVKHL